MFNQPLAHSRPCGEAWAASPDGGSVIRGAPPPPPPSPKAVGMLWGGGGEVPGDAGGGIPPKINTHSRQPSADKETRGDRWWGQLPPHPEEEEEEGSRAGGH